MTRPGTVPPMGEGLETSRGQRRALLDGSVSSRELVTDALGRAEATAGLGAFVSLAPDVALEEADAADRLIAATAPDDRWRLPPLLGLPTAHKDLVEVAGQPTTHGSRAVSHVVADADDRVAAAIRAAGAICIGKTQVPEFGLTAYSENDIAPPARNPHDPRLTAGGSSGGTAAAIAGGVIAAAIGSDAGGSIRIPSAACGLVGLKPGRGRVPCTRPPAGPAAGAPDLSVAGPMAADVEDAALWFDALMGEFSLPALAATRRGPGLHGLRVGVSFDSPFSSWTPIHFGAEACRAVADAAALLDGAGHRVEEARIDYAPGYPEAFTAVWTASLAGIALEPRAVPRLGELASSFLDRARARPPEVLEEACRTLHAFARDTLTRWCAYDVILTPALAGPPPAVGAFRELGPDGDYELQCQWAPTTSMVNVVGVPSIVVPMPGATLPVGVQLIGGPGTEHRLLQLAAQLLSRAPDPGGRRRAAPPTSRS